MRPPLGVGAEVVAEQEVVPFPGAPRCARTWIWTTRGWGGPVGSSGARSSRERRGTPGDSIAGTYDASSSGSGTLTWMSIIGLAANPGTEVEPMCSMRGAVRSQRRGKAATP